MRVNIYAEEITKRMQIISKEIDGEPFTGLRLFMELPVTLPGGKNFAGPFMHRPGDDDSAAVTFWGKRDLRELLVAALAALDMFYAARHPRPEREAVDLVNDLAEHGLRFDLNPAVQLLHVGEEPLANEYLAYMKRMDDSIRERAQAIIGTSKRVRPVAWVASKPGSSHPLHLSFDEGWSVEPVMFREE